jgi:hypothetical protein
VCGETGFDPLADREAECHVFVSIEFDGSVFRPSEHAAIELAAVAIEKYPVYPAGHVSDDVAEQ